MGGKRIAGIPADGGEATGDQDNVQAALRTSPTSAAPAVKGQGAGARRVHPIRPSHTWAIL